MRFPRYVPESPELIHAREAEDQEHRRFVYWSARAESNLLWAKDKTWGAFACFSHVYDAPANPLGWAA